MLGSLGYPWVRLQTRWAAQMHVTLLEISHVHSREQLLAPSTLPHILFFFTTPLHVHSSQGCAHMQLLLRETDGVQETLMVQKLWPGREPCSVPGEDNGEAD